MPRFRELLSSVEAQMPMLVHRLWQHYTADSNSTERQNRFALAAKPLKTCHWRALSNDCHDHDVDTAIPWLNFIVFPRKHGRILWRKCAFLGGLCAFLSRSLVDKFLPFLRATRSRWAPEPMVPIGVWSWSQCVTQRRRADAAKESASPHERRNDTFVGSSVHTRSLPW